jgi:5-methylcytosine-specific restriction endonuclease McrA
MGATKQHQLEEMDKEAERMDAEAREAGFESWDEYEASFFEEEKMTPLEIWLQGNNPQSRYWKEWEHSCESGGVVQRVLANGAKTYVEQCQICGKSIKVWKKQDIQTPYVGVWKDSLVTEWREAQKRVDEAARQERRKEYHSYLQSQAWKDKRAKVLARAKNLCEGCAEKPATEVHHLTYANVGNELLFELVALCSGCHSRSHASQFVPSFVEGEDQ